MSSTGAEPGDAADQAYFLALERAFLALRGQSTLLSAADWQTARAWHRAGIPVDFVVAVMESLFERQRERSSKRGISSLRYFRAAVAAAWDERLELQAGGADGRLAEAGPPAERRLAALAAAIPRALPGGEEARNRICALSGGLDEIERALAEVERELLAGVAERLDAAGRDALDAEVDRAVTRAGVPAAARDELRASLRRRRLRQLGGLPVLSLFAPEAQGEAGSES
jgi:hypothetical protein